MKKIIFFLFLVLFSFNVQAQADGCDGFRYIDDVFTDVSVTEGIKFGEGETFFGNFIELYLDVYEPKDDVLEKRPVIILAFGGSFISGERGDLDYLCEAYARKGYVAVSIDYRLYDGPLFPVPTGDQMKNVVIKTVSDMKAAIRYMRQDADTDNLYKIDPDKVFVGGVSAGSITAFHTAVIDEDDAFEPDIVEILEANGGIEGNSSDNYEYSSEVQGLVNFSGGLNDSGWIDENDPPFVSVHDDMDVVVPFGGGFASIFGIPIIYMEGSGRCQEVGDSVGVENQLRTIENSFGHVSYLSNTTSVTESVDYTASFVADIVCAGGPLNTNEVANNLESIQVIPNPTGGNISLVETNNIDLYLELYDVFGTRLNAYSNTSTLEVDQYPNGIYFLKMTDLDSESTKTIKVILER